MNIHRQFHRQFTHTVAETETTPDRPTTAAADLVLRGNIKF